MKKLICILVALSLLLFSTAALAASPTAYIGHWEDTVSQRAWLRIDQNWEGDFDVCVVWGSGIFECSEWYMTCTYDPTVGQLAYNNGCSYTIYYDADGNVTGSQTDYADASGIIWIDSDGYLRFLCNDDSLIGCRFAWSGD